MGQKEMSFGVCSSPKGCFLPCVLIHLCSHIRHNRDNVTARLGTEVTIFLPYILMLCQNQKRKWARVHEREHHHKIESAPAGVPGWLAECTCTVLLALLSLGGSAAPLAVRLSHGSNHKLGLVVHTVWPLARGSQALMEACLLSYLLKEDVSNTWFRQMWVSVTTSKASNYILLL